MYKLCHSAVRFPAFATCLFAGVLREFCCFVVITHLHKDLPDLQSSQGMLAVNKEVFMIFSLEIIC